MAGRILIVDDSPSMRKVMGMVLKTTGYTVVEANNGKDGLSKLDGPQFDLIVSDVNMPEMGGLEFAGQIRQRDNYRFTPILMLTTETDAAMKQQASELGVRAWLNKPFQPNMLLNAVKKLV